MSSHWQRQTPKKGLGVFQEKFGKKDFLKVADYEIPPIQAVGSDEGF